MTIEAHAKVNLTLEVYGKRPDGCHALRSLVVPISLADTLTVESADDGGVTSDTGYPDDLCVKAARALAERWSGEEGGKAEGWNSAKRNSPDPQLFSPQTDPNGMREVSCGFVDTPSPPSHFHPSVRFHVEKRIPVGGGLGGGSADAAAALVALNEMWRLGMSRAELAEVGAQVGSDVPALALGGPVMMEGRGERVTRLTDSPGDFRPLHLVLADPGVPSSTREVYAACSPRNVATPSPTDALIAAWRCGDAEGLSAALSNDLQKPAVRLHPEIAKALALLRAAGARGVLMSGSGSCVFGLAPDAAAARRMADEVAVRGMRAFPVRTLTSGEIG